MIARAVALITVCMTGAASAEDTVGSALRHAIELPSHDALQDMIGRPDTVLAPFETDGCSGGMSKAWSVVADIFLGFEESHEGTPPWQGCCVVHDRLYHDAAGTADAEASFHARLAADEELRACVAASGAARIDALSRKYNASPEQIRLAYETIGDAMFDAVRFGGGPCSGLTWRWGYGYPNCLPRLP